MTEQPIETTKFTILQRIEDSAPHTKFFTTFLPEVDQTKSYTGETIYRIIGYASSIKEAQLVIYENSPNLLAGRPFGG